MTTTPNARAFSAYEEKIFDAATLFTVVIYRSRGGRKRWEFTSLKEAIAHAQYLVETSYHPLVYAVTPAGRSIVLDRADWPRWLSRTQGDV